MQGLVSERIWLSLLLVLPGAGSGLSLPLTKIAVSTGDQPMAPIFSEVAISAALLGAVALMMVGLFLVQPRVKAVLVDAAPLPHDAR